MASRRAQFMLRLFSGGIPISCRSPDKQKPIIIKQVMFAWLE